ncbi:hypothetical protein BGLT_05198 [Caballeronia glathei]|nr:hypothetical protein BGLT_05198 [Caballeronia glathei]
MAIGFVMFSVACLMSFFEPFFVEKSEGTPTWYAVVGVIFWVGGALGVIGSFGAILWKLFP